MSSNVAAVVAILGAITAVLGTVLTYRQGTAGARALRISTTNAERQQETTNNLATQGAIIDQLQEERAAQRADMASVKADLATTQQSLAETITALRTTQGELADCQAQHRAAEAVGILLRREVDGLRTQVREHEQTIASQHRSINQLKRGHAP